MFLVVVVHSAEYLGCIAGFQTYDLIHTGALICDSLFFTLSGYFALAPQRRPLGDFYINKLVTIILPLFLYSLLLYLASSGFVGITFAGYIKYFEAYLHHGWWFIPALIPCLVVAPFISKGFEALSDESIAKLGLITCLLYGLGAACLFGEWAFNSVGLTVLSDVAILPTTIVKPSLLGPVPAYYQFFIFGGIYRRLASQLSRKQEKIIVFVGALSWAIDLGFKLAGVPRVDPSFFWLFATFGTFVLFEHVSIRGRLLRKCTTWVAKRSYSIYLLQLSVITYFASYLYKNSAFGQINDMADATRVLIWIGFVIASYCVSLAVASLVDVTALRPLQNVARSIISHKKSD